MRIGIPSNSMMKWGGGADLLKLMIAGLLQRSEHQFFVLVEVENKVPGRLEKVLRPLLKRWFWAFPPQIENRFPEFGNKVEVVPYVYRSDILKQLRLDVVVPSMDRSADVPSVAYVYDCQHKHLPEFFTKEEIDQRDRVFLNLLTKNRAAIVNSNDTKRDLLNFYPNTGCQIFSLPFAPVVRESWLEDQSERLKKFSLPPRYFLISNQFWIHKDHSTAFRALAEALVIQSDLHLVCTGEMTDFRWPEYMKKLERLLDELNLRDRVSFLGFIDKRDQIEILKNSVAILQPTLFEGGPGGGSVADALAVGARSIVSDIPVNLELPECAQVRFFQVGNASHLAERMLELWNEPYARPSDEWLTAQRAESVNKLSERLYETIEAAIAS